MICLMIASMCQIMMKMKSTKKEMIFLIADTMEEPADTAEGVWNNKKGDSGIALSPNESLNLTT